MEEIKKKVGDVIDQEMMDLAAGLREIWAGCSVDFLLDRLEFLSKAMDQAAEGVTPHWDEKEIISMAYWQRDIIGEMRQTLGTHYRMMGALAHKFEIPETGTEEEKTFTAGSRKLEALRGLMELFHCDKLFYSEKTAMATLKCWAATYECDFDKVLSLLDTDKESCLKKVA